MYPHLVLLTGELNHPDELESIKAKIAEKSTQPLHIQPFDQIEELDQSALYLSYLTDAEIKSWMVKFNGLEGQPALAILPNDACQYALRSFNISKDLDQAIEDGLDPERSVPMDLLLCNGTPVFRHLTVGDVFGLNKTLEPNLWQKIKAFWQNLHQIRFDSYSLITAKEQHIHTAATGLLVMEHNYRALGTNRVNEDLSSQDGKLNAFVLSPKSLIAYLTFLFMVFFVRRFTMQDLARSVGVIKTSRLWVNSSGRDIMYRLDGENLAASELDLQICPLAIRVHIGRNFGDIASLEVSQEEQQDDKDTIRIQALPQGEMSHALLSKPLPFFPRASDEDFKDLFVNLRTGAQFSESYIVLMILSAILAVTGLFMSSAPVIIGAMILAPLMSPIISLAMGVVRYEHNLMFSALKTVIWGTVVALFVATLYTWMIPLNTLTPEIEARLNPNLLDLMVAIVSGVAGAYASARSEVAKSLAGVAIAVALIPPLSVTGIGLGWGDWTIVLGSFLLFLTNLVGITLAAAITFIVLGYSPVTRAKKGISYTFILMSIIAIPLMISFYGLVQKNTLKQQMQATEWQVPSYVQVYITDLEIPYDAPVRVWVDIIADREVNGDLLRQLQHQMTESINRDIELEVTRRILLPSEPRVQDAETRSEASF